MCHVAGPQACVVPTMRADTAAQRCWRAPVRWDMEPRAGASIDRP